MLVCLTSILSQDQLLPSGSCPTLPGMCQSSGTALSLAQRAVTHVSTRQQFPSKLKRLWDMDQSQLFVINEA